MQSRRSLVVLFSVVVVDLIGFGIVVPVLPFYVDEFGASATVLGLLVASYAAMQFVFAPVWGRVSDRIGRRPVMLATIAGSSGALVVLGLAPSLGWLFAARVLGGVFGANISVASAYIADVTDEAERTRWMGMLGACFAIGFVVGGDPDVPECLRLARILDHVLDHGTSGDQDERLPWEARRRVAGRNNPQGRHDAMLADRQSVTLGPVAAPPANPSSTTTPARKAVVAVASNKGGVGKTFVATNLAVYLCALHQDLSVQLIGLDDQIGIDRMFAIGGRDPDAPNLKHAFAERSLDRALRLGEYGVHYVPSPPDTGPLKSRARDPRILSGMIERCSHPGLYVLDCKSDLEELTRAALRAADLVIVPVADQASLDEAAKIFELLARDGGVPGRARVLLTLVDRRTRVDRGIGVSLRSRRCFRLQRLVEDWIVRRALEVKRESLVMIL